MGPRILLLALASLTLGSCHHHGGGGGPSGSGAWHATGTQHDPLAGLGLITLTAAGLPRAEPAFDFELRLHVDGDGVVTGTYVDPHSGAGSANGSYVASDRHYALLVEGMARGTPFVMGMDVDAHGDGTLSGSYTLSIDGGDVTSGDIGGVPVRSRFHVDAAAAPGGHGTSWADAGASLQDAIAATPPGSEIWVSHGTYKPGTLPTDAFVIEKRIRIYGGFAGTETDLTQRDPLANPTILSGDLLGDDAPGFANRGDNANNIVRALSDASPGAPGPLILDGLTFSGGYATQPDPDAQGGDQRGGAIYFAAGGGLDSLGLAINGCTFTDNYALAMGGAVEIESGTALIADCRFIGNRADYVGGGLNALFVRATIRGCLFDGNVADDGAAFQLTNAAGPPSIFDCRFVGNHGSGSGSGSVVNLWDFPAPADPASEPTNTAAFVGCRFIGNGPGPEILAGYASARLVNCLFTGHVGGGDLVTMSNSYYQWKLSVRHCTFSQNDAAVFRTYSYPTGQTDGGRIDDSIAWGNTGAFLTTSTPSAVVTIASSCIQGGAAGIGNIADDPLLDADGRPQAGSPCIDTGTGGLASYDIDNVPRPTGAAADMGAYEQ
jgi:hypothetical protein